MLVKHQARNLKLAEMSCVFSPGSIAVDNFIPR